nr:protein takeout-like [Leptinotarsa decemlineata]
MDGKILVLPLKGNGDCNITATDLDFKYKTTYKVTEKNGESHMYLDQQSLDFNSTRFYFQFDNLFNGDPVLGPNTNKVLNDEWESVLMEIKPAIGEAVSAVASSIVNSISERVPYRFIVM